MTPPRNNRKASILLLVDRRQSRTARMLKSAGYNIITTFTPDHAVAICVNNKVDAVVLDQQHFIETEGWSVAKSIKMIRTSICVILVARGTLLNHDLPEGVDALAADHDDDALLQTLDRILPRSGRFAAG